MEPKSLLVLVVPLVVVTSVGSSRVNSEEQYLSWILANIVALSALAIPLFLFRYLWSRRFPEFKFPLGWVILIAAGVSLAKVWLTLTTVQWLGQDFQSQAELGARYISGVASGVIALLVTALVTSLLEEFQRERSLLLTAKVMQMSPALSEQEATALQELSGAVNTMLKNLEAEGRELRLELGVIRGLVDNHVRPLANSLYLAIARDYQDFSLRELFKSAVQKYPPALALALVSLLATPRNIDWYGLETGVGVSLISALLSAVLIFIAGRTFRKLGLNGAVTFFLSITTLPTLSYVACLELWSVADVDYMSLTLTSLFWFGQSGAVLTMASVALVNAREINQELQSLRGDLDLESTRALLLRNRKRFADQMHGEVQSRLMSLLLRAEANQNLQRQVAIEELRIISALLSAPRAKGELNEELKMLAKAWEGFAKIEVQFDFEAIPTELHELAVAVIEEGISNAVRHGFADHVKVSLLAPGRIVIEDNGMGPRGGRQGLGSMLISAGSQDWSLGARTDGGARLEVDLLARAKS